MILTGPQSQLIQTLRHTLHDCPERSGQERQTRACLIRFLREHTSLELNPCGEGLYAAHREPNTGLPSIAIRADYDAVPLPNGGAAHLCGHDGHAAALCGLALWLEGRTVSRNVFLLFQPAEETGAGAEPCCALFSREQIDEIYGAHNLPGVSLGQIQVRAGTFACASRGLTLTLTGKPTHAAYPEHGISPASAVGQLLCELPALSAPERYHSMTLCTVIGMQMGQKAFGKAASSAELWLTLRAEQDRDLASLQQRILTRAHALAGQYALFLSFSEQDIFPATVNSAHCAQTVLTACRGTELPVPMRWSEDFGHYLRHCPGAFFGIGAGTDCPPLHTENYEYPDTLLDKTVDAFARLIAHKASK